MLQSTICNAVSHIFKISLIRQSVPSQGNPFGIKKNPIPAFFYQIDYCLYASLPANTSYFHAQWRRQALTEIGKDYVILDGIKGTGQYIGTYLGLSTLQRYWWGEGEVKFYIDGDEEYPTICGTGMEDYFGGSWSFAANEAYKQNQSDKKMPVWDSYADSQLQYGHAYEKASQNMN